MLHFTDPCVSSWLRQLYLMLRKLEWLREHFQQRVRDGVLRIATVQTGSAAVDVYSVEEFSCFDSVWELQQR